MVRVVRLRAHAACERQLKFISTRALFGAGLFFFLVASCVTSPKLASERGFWPPTSAHGRHRRKVIHIALQASQNQDGLRLVGCTRGENANWSIL